MRTGDDTRKTVLARLSQAPDLSDIEHCQALWIQSHNYKSINFIHLPAELAFNRLNFWVHSQDNPIKQAIKSRLTPDILLPLRRSILIENIAYTQTVFSGLNLHIVPAYGPRQDVGLFLLNPNVFAPLTTYERLSLSQNLYMFQHGLFNNSSSRAAPTTRLTSREAEALSWVVQGKTNVAIANIMNLSPHTVDNFLRRTYAKLGVNNRTAAAVKALMRGEAGL